MEGAYTATKSLLENHPEITAIFSTNNLITEGVLKAFKKANVKFPEEVALVGFDDPEWAGCFNPSITSVAQQPYEMGYKASTLLFERIKNNKNELESREIEFGPTLKIRESSVG